MQSFSLKLWDLLLLLVIWQTGGFTLAVMVAQNQSTPLSKHLDVSSCCTLDILLRLRSFTQGSHNFRGNINSRPVMLISRFIFFSVRALQDNIFLISHLNICLTLREHIVPLKPFSLKFLNLI